MSYSINNVILTIQVNVLTVTLKLNCTSYTIIQLTVQVNNLTDVNYKVGRNPPRDQIGACKWMCSVPYLARKHTSQDTATNNHLK